MDNRFETPEEPAPVPSSEQNVPSPEAKPQEQTQGAAFTPLEQSATAGAVADTGWSWGAFLLNIIFLVAIRKYWLAAIIVLLPFLSFPLALLAPNFLVLIPIFLVVGYGGIFVIMIFLGIKGRGMASKSATFANRDEYIGFMKGIDHGCKVIFLTYLTIAIVDVLASIVLASLFGGALP